MTDTIHIESIDFDFLRHRRSKLNEKMAGNLLQGQRLVHNGIRHSLLIKHAINAKTHSSYPGFGAICGYFLVVCSQRCHA